MTNAPTVEMPQLVEPPHTVEQSLTGKAFVKYQCPKCRVLQRRGLVDAGHQEQCEKCGHTHTVPGIEKKLARMAARQKEQTEAASAAPKRPLVVPNWKWLTWSPSLIILRAVIILVALQLLVSVIAFINFWAATASAAPAVREYSAVEALGRLSGIAIVFAFFCVLLCGYAIASAIDRGFKLIAEAARPGRQDT